MSVIRKKEIARRLNLPITEAESLVITPLLQLSSLFRSNADDDSIDLRLGTNFLLPRVPPQPFTYPSKNFAKQSHLRLHVPLGSFLVIPAHQTVLGSTLEFLKLPSDLSGQILTKSSIRGTFIVIETAPWIHPSYRGCLTLEIANVSNTPLILYPGRTIAQLILLELIGAEKLDRKLSGTYLGPIYPEAPVFNDPEEDLQQIGVPPDDIISPIRPRK